MKNSNNIEKITIENIYDFFVDAIKISILSNKMKTRIDNIIEYMEKYSKGTYDYSDILNFLIDVQEKILAMVNSKKPNFFENDLHKLNYFLVVMKSEFVKTFKRNDHK